MSLAEISLDEIATMKVIDLKQHLKDLKLPLHGNKTELQKRLSDALTASKQPTADNNNNNSKKPPPSSASASASASTSAAPANKSSESNHNVPPSSESNAQGKNTNESTSIKTEEKNDASTENAHADEDDDKAPDGNGHPQNDAASRQKKLSNIKRIEVEGLPEELLVWETETTSTTGNKGNGISRNLGVTTAELMLQRQERIKKYGLQAMPEQVKRMLRKQRFHRNNNDNSPNKPQNDEENENNNATSNDTNTNPKSDFSIQSVLAGDGTSEGLTREKLSQRKKRFGDLAVQSAFQESQQITYEHKNRNRDNRNRNRGHNYNNNRNNNNNNNAAGMNQSGNIRRNRDRNMMDDRIRARMDRFGTKPLREHNNRRGFDRDWNTRDRRAQRYQDRPRTSRRNNRDRSRSRQRNRENEVARLDEELDNVVESTIHTATKTGGIMKDFGSDEEFGPSAEDLERIEQRRKRFEG